MYRQLLIITRERYERDGVDAATAKARLHDMQRELAEKHRERLAKLDEMLACLPDDQVY